MKSLSIIWKSELPNWIKWDFFQAVTKHFENKLDGNYTRILHAVLNKFKKQFLTQHQLFGHLPTISQTSQVRHAGH